ncbi:MAG: hypothetical protein HRT45_15250 [Bdellovibrionales bacterium]|nr:hypothetical protein [Bdellovibrionales bacterium]
MTYSTLATWQMQITSHRFQVKMSIGLMGILEISTGVNAPDGGIGGIRPDSAEDVR